MPARKTGGEQPAAASPAPPARRGRTTSASASAAEPDLRAPSEVLTDNPPRRLPGSVTASAVLLLIFGSLAGLGTAFMVLTALTFAAIPMGPMVDPASYDLCKDPAAVRGCLWAGQYGYGMDFAGTWFMGIASVGLVGVVGAAVTGGHVAAGIAILQRRNWARILGMVVSGAALIVIVLGLGFSLITALTPMPPIEDPMGAGWDAYYAMTMAATVVFGTVVAVGIGAAYAFILWVLARRGDVFE